MRSDPEPGRISMATIGQRLREAREKKGLSVDQAQKQTRIHTAVLNALEEGRCGDMLTDVYVSAFLKKYSQYLGLDSHEIMKTYQIISTPPRRSAETAQPESEKKPDRPRATLMIKPRPELKLTDIDAERSVRKFRLGVIVILSLSVAFFAVKNIAKNSAGRKTTRAVVTVQQKKPSRPAAQEAKKPAAEKVSIPANVPLKVEVAVKKRVLLKVRVDGNLRFSRVLEKGSKETFTAESSVNIYTGMAENIGIKINGEAVPIPGKGLLKDLEITRKGVKINDI
jgi:transcriptional regulator with XRE-family HTH domain